MTNFQVRISDDLASRFDALAAGQGGRSATLRRLMEGACAASLAPVERRPSRPAKLTVRLSEDDARGLAYTAGGLGLTPNAWAAALIRARLRDRPTWPAAEAQAVLAIQAELRRIGININQIARALNVAVLEGKTLELEVTYLEDLRREIRGHLDGLRQALAGNLAYWRADP